MTLLDASSVAALLREFGQRIALRRGNPFRAKAYARAADNLLALSLPLNQVIAQHRLREIPGVGDAIADIIKKLHPTGTHPALEKMRKEIPAGVFEMLSIPGLQANKVLKLHHVLGLNSVAGLEEAVREGRLQKIKGLILHAHTDRSGGVDTLETMAESTLTRGCQYFGVADHSRSAHYAGGLNEDEVAEQQAEAERLNRKYRKRFRIFKGIESDILADGSLDYPDGLLETFDFVVASVHGRFNMDRAAQTERIICAVSNPYTTILGHMTGRQLLRRPATTSTLRRCLRHVRSTVSWSRSTQTRGGSILTGVGMRGL
jgi:hypothetical protein